MIKRKYVIFKCSCGEYAMLFVPLIQHDHVNLKTYNPVAAGFVDIGIEEGKLLIRCYGKSMSLKLTSRGGLDEKVIRETLDL